MVCLQWERSAVGRPFQFHFTDAVASYTRHSRWERWERWESHGEREPVLRTQHCTDSPASDWPAVCSCHTAVFAALSLVRQANAGLWLVHWVRAAHPCGEFGGQLNVKSKVTPPAQAAPATGHSLMENLKMLFFFAKIKFAILPSSSVAKVQSCCSVADKNFDLQNMCPNVSTESYKFWRTFSLSLSASVVVFCALLTTGMWPFFQWTIKVSCKLKHLLSRSSFLALGIFNHFCDCNIDNETFQQGGNVMHRKSWTEADDKSFLTF